MVLFVLVCMNTGSVGGGSIPLSPKKGMLKCWILITFPNGIIKEQIPVSFADIREAYQKYKNDKGEY